MVYLFIYNGSTRQWELHHAWRPSDDPALMQLGTVHFLCQERPEYSYLAW